MGVIVPQVITEDRAGGALVVDGSLRFDSSKSQYLTRTPSTAGNRTTWTWSGWVKKCASKNQVLLSCVGAQSDTQALFIDFLSDDTLRILGWSTVWRKTTQVFRDPSAWYHIVVAFDSTQATAANRIKLYVNGLEITTFATNNAPTQNTDYGINQAALHEIGRYQVSGTGYDYLSGYLTNIYFIDGQALDPSYFGYTDSLTNTWRPKKYKNTVALPGDSGGAVGFGTNGFWLPFDGSAPIGQDQSGKVGIAWTAVNFGGSNTIEKATGALPILNTDGGGKVARVGVRTDAYASSLVLALPLVGIKSDFSNKINSGTTEKAITSTNAVASSAQSNFYGGSWYFDGSGDYLSLTLESMASTNHTIEFWMYATDGSTLQALFEMGSGGDGALQCILNSGNFNYGTSGSSKSGKPYATNKWQHVALVYDGTNFKTFADGVQISSYTQSSAINSDTTIKIGSNGAGSGQYFAGYISDFRIYKGVAKYTSDFIPASTDPDIVPDSPSGVSYSSNLVPVTEGAVYFDGSGDYLSLASSTDFDISSGAYTVELYINFSSSPSIVVIFGLAGTSTSGNAHLLYSEGVLYWQTRGTSSNQTTYSWSPSLSRWYHFAVSWNGSNSLKLFIDGVEVASNTVSPTINQNGVNIGGASDGYSVNGFISNLHVVKGTALYTSNFTPPSAPISSVANTKLLCCKSNSTPLSTEISPGLIGPPVTASGNAAASTTNPFSSATAGSISLDGTGDYLQASGSFWSAHSPATFEAWIYCTNISYVDGTQIFETGGQGDFCILSNGALRVHPVSANAHDTPSSTISTNTWYHVALVQTTTTRKIFVNGVQQTLTAALGDGLTTNWNNPTGNPGFGKAGTYRGDFPGYMSNIRISDYEVYTSNFTPRTTPFDTVTEANNLLTAFSRTSSTASAGTNAKATNFNPFTANINTQRGKSSGYATLNPLTTASGNTLSNGNLFCNFPGTASGTANAGPSVASIAISSGKWYWEFENTVSNWYNVGIAPVSVVANYNFATAPSNLVEQTGVLSYYLRNPGYFYTGASFVQYGSDHAVNDITGVALNFDAGTLTYYKNGVSEGIATTGISGTYLPFFENSTIQSSGGGSVNFGQKPFKFPPPAGFQPLTLANTPRPTIVRPDQYVGIVTYYAADAVAGVATGLSFKPDLVWVKSRTTVRSHVLVDSVRGTNNVLHTDLTDGDFSSSQYITSFNSNGFSYGVAGDVTNNSNLVGWCWKAGGNSNTFNINDVGYASAAAAGLTAGTITPTGASVNTKSGFSIIKYNSGGSTGNYTISHGLTQTPKFIIHKSLGTSNWWVYHASVIDNLAKYLQLNSTNQVATNSANMWGGQFPDSSVLGVRVGDLIGTNTDAIMYVWAEIPGFSKFGSYTGNGNADGPVIITGFSPRWIMVKSSSTNDAGNGDWIIYDTARSSYNPQINRLYANYIGAESSLSGYALDVLSNGFKPRSGLANYGFNTSSVTYIYAAFAEAPTFNLYGAQANAR